MIGATSPFDQLHITKLESAWLVHPAHLTKSDCTNGFSAQRVYCYVLPKCRGVIQACGLAPVDVCQVYSSLGECRSHLTSMGSVSETTLTMMHWQ